MAIDIAKARHEVLTAIPGKKRRRRLTVLNQMEDFQRLITSLARYGRPVRAAFEATGSDHHALAYHLATAGFEVKQAVVSGFGAYPASSAQQLGQERPQGCSGHPSEAGDRE